MSELRAEAGVLAWEKLTDEQKQAGRQAHGLLVDMAMSGDKVDKPKLSFLPRLDPERHSRVLLIDGGRGSGKTALLLTVLDFWREPFNGGEGKDKDKAIPVELEEAGKLRRQIVPVGLLDLHPLPPSANLLLHVVGRLERVVEWLEGDGKVEREPPAWHLAANGVLESRTTWRKLLGAVAAGWDGGSEQRRARLDAEAHAAELEEAERQRLDLVTTFTAFMEALVEDFQKDRRAPAKVPLFVLAVDDADMNPSRSVELLDMLRMLWHPRLAFVLTGDSELFEQTLAEHFLGELRKPLLGHGIVQAEIEGLAERRRHVMLAREVYDKVIPLGQRCYLPPISPALRMEVPW